MKIHIIHTMKIEVTKVTARGQIVIPQEIRKEIGIEKGTQLLVYTEDDAMILKPVLVRGMLRLLEPMVRRLWF
jgi:AbrB family looped-hinge helix DNA binding protein